MYIEVKFKININNNQQKAFAREIKSYIESNVIDERGICSDDFQDEVMENLGYADEFRKDLGI